MSWIGVVSIWKTQWWVWNLGMDWNEEPFDSQFVLLEIHQPHNCMGMVRGTPKFLRIPVSDFWTADGAYDYEGGCDGIVGLNRDDLWTRSNDPNLCYDSMEPNWSASEPLLTSIWARLSSLKTASYFETSGDWDIAECILYARRNSFCWDHTAILGVSDYTWCTSDTNI